MDIIIGYHSDPGYDAYSIAKKFATEVYSVPVQLRPYGTLEELLQAQAALEVSSISVPSNILSSAGIDTTKFFEGKHLCPAGYTKGGQNEIYALLVAMPRS
jgi:hypothetical protein